MEAQKGIEAVERGQRERIFLHKVTLVTIVILSKPCHPSHPSHPIVILVTQASLVTQLKVTWVTRLTWVTKTTTTLVKIAWNP